MSRFKMFIKDHIFVSVIFLLSTLCVIGFYCLTTKGSEVIYPIFIILYFYASYMVVEWVLYANNQKNITRLSDNAVIALSAKEEYARVYKVINKLHRNYNDKIAKLSDEHREDKRFIAGYIHNLKTPVTVSSIIIQRVEAKEIKPEDAIDALKTELERLNTGLNMLLDIQRIEELEKDYEPCKIDLANDLRNVINANKSLFINSGVFPVFESGKCLVYSDSKWNDVLITQIISNAVKYSKGGENKHIYFDISERENYVDLIIKDEGIGIPEHDIPRVFEPFFTGDNGRKGYNASGIGLYLCKTICDRLGQKIRIENDNGCKVTITYLSKL